MSSTDLIRASGLANVLFGVLVAASAAVRLAGGDTVAAAWLAFAGVAFGLPGLVGIYLVQVERIGVPGLVAFIVAIAGLALSLGQLYGLTFSAPRTGPLGPLFPLGYGPFLFGLLPLDVIVIRARVLPGLAAASLILGAAMNAAGFAAVEVRLLGVVVFGAGAVWLGRALWAGTTARNARTEAMA